MLNLSQLRKVLVAALTDATRTFSEVDDNSSKGLNAGNFDGDAEGFHMEFSRSQYESDEDFEQAKETYLAAFWVEIEHLQESYGTK